MICQLVRKLVRLGLDFAFGPEEPFDYTRPTTPYERRTTLEDVY